MAAAIEVHHKRIRANDRSIKYLGSDTSNKFYNLAEIWKKRRSAITVFSRKSDLYFYMPFAKTACFGRLVDWVSFSIFLIPSSIMRLLT